MSETDTMFNERDRRYAAVQRMLSTDPSYDNRTIASTLKMQMRTVHHAQGDENKVSGCGYGLWCGFKWGPHRAISHLRSQSGGQWQTLGVAAGLGAGPQVERDPGLASEGVLRLCTLLSLAPSSPDLNPLDYFVWLYVENITNMTSHNTKASLIAAIRRVFAELPPALVERVCSKFRIRIEAVIEAEGGYIELMSALLHNQVTWIDFFYKSFKIKLCFFFFWTTILSFHPEFKIPVSIGFKFTTFESMCPLALFRSFLSNTGAYTELRTAFFI